ncbi:ABC transporter ATP-binding protein [bacterium]|nr:ABC transporter ATP-binding protein [bacterium]
MSAALIECLDFCFSYNGLTILDHLSFEVRSGDFLTVIGSNGAGKTTLLKCLLRIESGSSGQITIAGKALSDYSQKELATLLSYVPQSAEVMAPFSVYEFVMMGRYPYARPFVSVSRADREAVERALIQTGSEQLSDRLLRTLSGGERQKVIIAAALAQGARVMLLDEPTTFLDPKHQVEIYNLLVQLNRVEGITIISVTHDVTTALMIGQRILALKGGRILYDGPAAALHESEILTNLFETPFLFDHLAQMGTKVVLPKGFITT